MTLERVYAVWDYWDGIRSGFADFRGSPHYFAATWEESSDDHAPVFTLVPVSRHTIELVSEHSAIFLRWLASFHRGDATEASHPKVAGQDHRYTELEREIRAATNPTQQAPHRMLGRFEVLPGQEHVPPGMMRDVGVEWSEP